ncbi:hypothetical protein BHE74_00038534 [Ensete ventricosum]|nr:hypothetical protein GW17_00019502 [Ensete ventricosum]RWW54862.1 hypothetical protein BHE74_00038534 [Ensete ventricosum]
MKMAMDGSKVKTGLRLSEAKAFLHQVLLDCHRKPGRRSGALGMVTSPDTYQRMQSLPSNPCRVPHGSQFTM